MTSAESSERPRHLGATYLGNGRTAFLVWAPLASDVDLVLERDHRMVPMAALGNGYFATETEAWPGTEYRYSLDGTKVRPDPASRAQPIGVHGPSAVVDERGFPWTDANWRGRPLDEYVIYEIHVGTFTAEGTFDGVATHLDELVDLGITAVEIMPIAAFPGNRNWGYDGVQPFAAHVAYGGLEGFQRLVDACHQRG